MSPRCFQIPRKRVQGLEKLLELVRSHAKKPYETRMHSSRMRTVRCSGHLRGGGSAHGECLPDTTPCEQNHRQE